MKKCNNLKKVILDQTNCGLDIYSKVMSLIQGYEVIVKDYNGFCSPKHISINGRSLVMMIRKEDDQFVYSDKNNYKFKGDSFDFAELYFNLKGKDLLHRIVKELDITIVSEEDQTFDIVESSRVKVSTNSWLHKACISFYDPPISNTKPTANLSILEVAEIIKSGKYKTTTEELRNLKTGEEAKLFKSTKFPYVTFSGTFNSRKKSDLILHSGFIVFDFDHVENIEELKKTLLNVDHLPTVLLFVSPSGDGLKWVTKVDHEEVSFSHDQTYNAIKLYLEQEYDVTVDPGGDVSRACFLPYDANVYIGADEVFSDKCWFDVEYWLSKKESNLPKAKCHVKQDDLNGKQPEKKIVDQNQYDQVEQYIQQIEERQVDIAPRYEEFRNIGFALCSEFGEEGRYFYHRICKFYSKYEKAETDKQYTKCLNSPGNGISIATFFHLANNLGCQPVNVQQEAVQNRVVKNTGFPNDIMAKLPKILAESMSKLEPGYERDVYFVSALGVLSACLPNIEGIYFDKKLSSHLYVFIIAPAGAGKGNMNWAKELGNGIHKSFLASYNEQMSELKQKNAAFRLPDKKMNSIPNTTEKPTRKMFYTPANSSSSAFTKSLSQSDNRGAIFENEADTLAETFKKEWGNFSDLLRKAYHHEDSAMNRRKDDELVELHRPHLAIILSGTPNQLKKIIPNTENGFFSRFLYFNFESTGEFKNGVKKQSGISLSDYFERVGLKVKDFYEKLDSLKKPIDFEWPEYFGDLLVESLNLKLKTNYCLIGEDSNGIYRRLGVAVYRISMILSAYRYIDEDELPAKIVCREKEFNLALQIISVLEQHMFKSYFSLKRNSKLGERFDFYYALPDKFNAQEMISIAAELGMSKATAYRRISEYIEEGLIVKEYNTYTKVLSV